jgi:hypothetical protein
LRKIGRYRAKIKRRETVTAKQH